jgi:hypothetical protein
VGAEPALACQRFGAPTPRRGNQMGRGMPSTTYPSAPGDPNDYVFIAAQQRMWPAVAPAGTLPPMTPLGFLWKSSGCSIYSIITL